MTDTGKNMCEFCSPFIKDHVFLESDHFLVVYNIAPILPGHSLVIPKQHIESLLDLDDSQLLEFVRLSREATRILLRAFDAAGFNWTIQEGEEAGQTISHLHLHLIPRKTADMPQPGDWYPALIDSEDRPKLEQKKMRRIVEDLRRAVKTASNGESS